MGLFSRASARPDERKQDEDLVEGHRTKAGERLESIPKIDGCPVEAMEVYVGERKSGVAQVIF